MSLNYPAFKNELFVYSEDKRVLYLLPDAPDWITINQCYKPIFNLFTGQHSVNEISEFISRNYKNEENILNAQISEFIKTSMLFTHNIQNECKDTPFQPRYIYLTLSDQCNLRCVYCYAEERKKIENVSFSEWCKYIDKVLEVTKECTFVFTGGEPLLVPYVFELADYIRQRNQRTILITNGTQIVNQQIASKVSQLFNHIRVSLDSVDEQVNSYLRGKRTSSKVIASIELLESVQADYMVMSTVSKLNKDKIDDFSQYFNNKVYFQPLYQMGRGRGLEDLSISGTEYYNALTKTSAFKFLQGYHNTIHTFKNNPNKRCAMAKEEISIAPNGDIFPCHMLHYEDLKIGNLNEDDLITLYYSSNKMKALRKVNVDSINQCSTCEFRNFCGGSCRARADYTLNGIEGYNNFCDFEKAAILKALLYSYG